MTTAAKDTNEKTKNESKTSTAEKALQSARKEYAKPLRVELSDIKETASGSKKRRRARRIKAQAKEKPQIAAASKPVGDQKKHASSKDEAVKKEVEAKAKDVPAVEKKRKMHKTKTPTPSAKQPSSPVEIVPELPELIEKKTEAVRFVPLEEKDFEPSSVREISSEIPPFKPLQELTDPISAMLAQASTSAHERLFPSFLRFIGKYSIIALAFTVWIQSFLNRQAFGFARMTFSDAAALFLRMVLIGLFLEMVDSLVLNALAAHRPERKYLLRLGDISAACAGFLALIFGISFAAFFLHWRIGIAALASAACMAVLLRASAYAYTYQCGRRRSLLAMAIIVALNMFLVLLLIQFVGKDVIRILQSYIRL